MFLATFAFVFGTIVGSFINVIVLRYGFTEAKRSRSGCMACGAQLHWYELVPVISFVVLRGRCGACGSTLSPQYPLVELALGTLFAGSVLLAYPFATLLSVVQFILTLIFWASFLALTVYDVRHTLVPVAFAVPTVLSAASIRIAEAVLTGNIFPLYDAMLGALLFGGFLLFLFLITRGRGMGFGDVYVGVALGLLFGITQSLDVATLAFWIGAAIGIALLALKKSATMKSEVPFVPFLFLAAVIGMFTAFSPLSFIAALMAGV